MGDIYSSVHWDRPLQSVYLKNCSVQCCRPLCSDTWAKLVLTSASPDKFGLRLALLLLGLLSAALPALSNCCFWKRRGLHRVRLGRLGSFLCDSLGDNELSFELSFISVPKWLCQVERTQQFPQVFKTKLCLRLLLVYLFCQLVSQTWK